MKILVGNKIWKLLRGNGFQIAANTTAEIDGYIERIISIAIDGIKQEEGNIKRVDGKLVVAHIMKSVKKSGNGNNGTKACQKCAGIKDVFLKAARDLQVMVTDEAKIALLALERNKKYVK